MRRSFSVYWLAILILSSVMVKVGECEEAGIKKTFIDLERIARLPEQDQKKEVLRIYDEIYLTTESHRPMLQPLPDENNEALTPEQRADRLEQAGPGNVRLFIGAHFRCQEILGKYKQCFVKTQATS